MAKINLIVALSTNDAIGRDNDLPWRLKTDLQLFKKLTSYSTLIMGRKTFDSLPGLLPNRFHVVVTRNKDLLVPNNRVLYVNSLEEALNYVHNNREDAFIVGGAQIYTEALSKDVVDVVYYTRVYVVLEDADTFLPLGRLLSPKNRWLHMDNSFYPKTEVDDHSFMTYKLVRVPR